MRDLRIVGDHLTALIQSADTEIVRKWDLMTGKSQSASTTEINWRSKLQLELSSQGTLIAAHKEDTAHVYNAATLKRITMVKAPSVVRSVGFDPQDTKVAIGTDTGTVQIHAVTK
jgi:WD40 repeat protein